MPTSSASPAPSTQHIEIHAMNKKQTILVALLCAAAAILAGLMLWRPLSSSSTPTAAGGHESHEDAHGHDDRHPEAGTPAADAGEEGAITMSAAQVKANGIAVDSARPARIRERLHVPAQVLANAERSVVLAAPAQGIVQALPVAVGASVRKGQVLAIVQSPAVAGWRADAGVARQRLALARTTWQREKSLWEQGISARQDLDAAEAALKEAEIGFDAARQRLAALGLAVGEGVSSSVTVRAPFDGVVIDKPAVAGQALDDSKPLLTVADLSQVWVEAALPADSLAQIGAGMPARVSVGAQPNEIEGKVAFVGPVLGEATRMATVRIVLPNPGGRLRPGMLASVDLMGQALDAPVTVANEALQTIHEHKVVFVRSASGFRAQDVVTGRSDGRRTEIVSGLAAGTAHAAAGSYVLKADLGKRDAGHED
jgi:cobalt-zinc-cadmium efflux system membrane fusion protein